jgi:hypothetical protein
VLHLVVAAALEDVDEADQVAVDIGVGVLDRIADTGLRSEVDHLVELLGGKKLLHAGPVGDVQLDEAESGMAGQSGQPAFLEADRIVVVQVVEADDFIAARQEA